MFNTSLAYYVHHFDPFLLRFSENWGLRWYGLSYVIGFVLGYWLLGRLHRRGFFPVGGEALSQFVTGAALSVLVGGRLGYFLLYRWGEFVERPWVFFQFLDGGMSAHGGVAGLMLFLWWYAWRHGYSWRGLGDHVVVVAPLGLFFGRLANFINGELYGRASEVPWAVQFPLELYECSQGQLAAVKEACVGLVEPVQIAAIITASRESIAVREVLANFLTPRHPSQLYEAALEGALLFGILWVLRIRFARLPVGILTGVFFIGYAVFRSVAEWFREPDASLIMGMTRGQFYSLFMIAIGVAFLLSARWAPRSTNK